MTGFGTIAVMRVTVGLLGIASRVESGIRSCLTLVNSHRYLIVVFPLTRVTSRKSSASVHQRISSH